MDVLLNLSKLSLNSHKNHKPKEGVEPDKKDISAKEESLPVQPLSRLVGGNKPQRAEGKPLFGNREPYHSTSAIAKRVKNGSRKRLDAA